MKAKINKSLVNTLKPGNKDIKIRDTDLSGFELKLTPKGKIVYRVDYNINGRRRYVTIGNTGTTPDQARALAAKTLQAVAAGEDPAQKIAEEKKGFTLSDACDKYMNEHARTKKRPRSAREDELMIGRLIKPAIGKMKLSAVTPNDIGKLHHKLRSTPTQANRVRTLLMKIFNLAETWGLRPLNSNPCARIAKYREEQRRRYLSAEEFARLGTALNEAEAPGGEAAQAVAAIRLLILTGARLSEITTLAKWQYLDRERRVLKLPDSKTGYKDIPVSRAAMEVLDNIPPVIGNDHIISGIKPGKPFTATGKVWRRIRRRAELPDVRLHDLRHSFASIGVLGHMGLPVIGAILGHNSVVTTGRYAHLAIDPAAESAERISEEINAKMKREPRRLRAVK